MRVGIVIWPLAFLVSFGVHMMLAGAVSGLSEATQPEPQSELMIGEKLSFVSATLTPSTIETSSALRVSSNTNDTEIQPEVRAKNLQPVESVKALPVTVRPRQQALAPVSAPQVQPLKYDGEAQAATSSSGNALEPVVDFSQLAKVTNDKRPASVDTESMPLQPIAETGTVTTASSAHVTTVSPTNKNAVEAIQAGGVGILQPNKVADASVAARPVAGSQEIPARKSTGAAAQKPNLSITVKPTEAQQASKAPVKKLALLQPIPIPPAVAPRENRHDKFVKLVRNYDGGPCFLAMPVDDEGVKLAIESFSSRNEPMLQLQKAIRFNLGADVNVGVRKITEDQCPVIGFIDTMLKSRIPELKVGLRNTSISNGGQISGNVGGVRLPWINLLLVDDDGMVHDISSYGSMAGGYLRFSAPVTITAMGKSRYQLVIAIAASKELRILNLSEPVSSSNLFEGALRKANELNAEIAIGIGAFRVE